MFEEKAQEAAKPMVKERAKVNRFVVSTLGTNYTFTWIKLFNVFLILTFG